MQRKYTANWKFFKEWSPDMAYVLGFIIADGNICRTTNNVSMRVKVSDRDLLERINVAMESTHPIQVFERSGGFDGEDLAALQIYGAELKHDLMARGVVPGKTYAMAFPAVPDAYLPEFVRGFFDGDGCVCTYTDQKNRPGYVGLRTFFICHDRNFLKILGDLLRQHVGIIPKIYPVSDSWRLQYGGRESIALYDWMYASDPDICLRRKKTVFETWLSERGIADSYKRQCRRCSMPFVRISGLNYLCNDCKKAKPSARYSLLLPATAS